MVFDVWINIGDDRSAVLLAAEVGAPEGPVTRPRIELVTARPHRSPLPTNSWTATTLIVLRIVDSFIPDLSRRLACAAPKLTPNLIFGRATQANSSFRHPRPGSTSHIVEFEIHFAGGTLARKRGIVKQIGSEL